MRKLLKVLVFSFLSLSLFSYAAQADDAEEIAALMAEFYDGLADVIERNMDDPDWCLSEVGAYYKENEATVQRVRELAEKAMEEAAALMQEYESMKNEYNGTDHMALEQLKGPAEEDSAQGGSPAEHETDRYTQALQAFMLKYPSHGLKIVMKAMKFIPGAKTAE